MGEPLGERITVQGRVLDQDGRAVPGAMVEIWQCNAAGRYHHVGDQHDAPLDPNFVGGGRVRTDAEGRYKFRSILPSGYCCPPDGQTQKLLNGLGRHGNRPAHIHFFVTAPGYRKLTTQINIDGDAYLHDDFAFATRDDLIPTVRHVGDPAAIHAKGVNAPFAEITFDFVLHAEAASAPTTIVQRAHAEAA